LTAGFAGLGFARFIVPVLILLLLCRQIGNVTLIFAGTSRLPMVAGWDGFLPAWFTRLHPRFKTPLNSVMFVGGVTMACALAGQAGVGVQEAFQLLENAAGILYAFTYLALFAIPLFRSEEARVHAAALACEWPRRQVLGVAALFRAQRVSDHRRRELAGVHGQGRR
jgi:amino acid transporter